MQIKTTMRYHLTLARMLLISRQVMSDYFMTPWTEVHQASLSLTISRSLPKFMSIELIMLIDHLIRCCPLLLLPSNFPRIRVSGQNAVCCAYSLSLVQFFATPRISLPGSSVNGILQARILEWVAIPSSRGSSQPSDQTQVSRTADGFFTV